MSGNEHDIKLPIDILYPQVYNAFQNDVLYNNRKYFLPWFQWIGNVFGVFKSRVQNYHTVIVREHCCLVVSLEIPETVVFSVHSCVTGCGWPNYYNVCHKMIISIPVIKKSTVSASAVKVATNFKMFQLLCTEPFMRSHVDFNVYYLRRNILHHNFVLLVQSDTTHQCRCVSHVWSVKLEYGIWMGWHLI